MKLCFQDKTLRLPSNQDLILYERDSHFWCTTSKSTAFYFKSRLTCKQAQWPQFFIAFLNVHIMNVNYAKFKKSLIVEQFHGNYLKCFIWKQKSLWARNAWLVGSWVQAKNAWLIFLMYKQAILSWSGITIRRWTIHGIMFKNYALQ